MIRNDDNKILVLRGAADQQPDENFMKLKEVATMLSVSPQSIRNWIRRKRLPSYQVGRVLRFKKQEILNWLKKEAQNGSLSEEGF